MNSLLLQQVATEENFSEREYLASNPDVAAAVQSGSLPSGWSHFTQWGKSERREMRLATDTLAEAKIHKLNRLGTILDLTRTHIRTDLYFDFLTSELRQEFSIIDTENVSSHPYDAPAIEMIDRNRNGLVLDVGAGKRPVYFDHVVNYEIVPYDSTDVLGVAEVLPFKDCSFDAIISVAVLEHVKDPFRCAREMCRVLKPGGELFAVVPFNCPLHGYPHHYYNMTHQGLKNLFDHSLTVERQDVLPSTLPIWNLAWYLRSWADGLSGAARDEFLNMRISELTDEPTAYLEKAFVQELNRDKNLELAACTAIWARKP